MWRCTATSSQLPRNLAAPPPRRRWNAVVRQAAARQGGGDPLGGGAGGEGDRLGGDGVAFDGGHVDIPAALGGGVPRQGGELLHLQGVLNAPGRAPGVRYVRLHVREGGAHLPQPAPRTGAGEG